MAITYPIQNKFEISEIVNIFAARLADNFYGLLRLTRITAGLIGLVILAIPLLFISPLIYIYMRQANKELSKKLVKVYSWINTASPSDLRYAHLAVEKKYVFYMRLMNKKKIIDSNIFTMGVSSQTNLLIQQVVDLETTLKSAAYPDIDKELTSADVDELLSIYSVNEMDLDPEFISEAHN